MKAYAKFREIATLRSEKEKQFELQRAI